MPLPLGEMILPADMQGTVIADEPCPPIKSGRGAGGSGDGDPPEFERARTDPCRRAGKEERVRPTGNHPFYSVDRSQWVAAEGLREGEHLQGIQGRLTLLHSERLPGVHASTT